MAETEAGMLEEVHRIAMILHRSIPPGSDGVMVLLALSMLISAGLNYGPEESRGEVMDCCIGTIKDPSVVFVTPKHSVN